MQRAVLLLLLALLLHAPGPARASAGSSDEDCGIPGYIFLRGVQQERWEAIRNCAPLHEPETTCTDQQDCVAFSSTGWTYRAPRATACPSGSGSLSSLEFNWPWRWVPLKCREYNPCCGSYVAVDRGANAPFELTCTTTSAPPPLGPSDRSGCYQNTACPRLDVTNFFESVDDFEDECCRQLPGGSFCGGSGSGRRHRRSLAFAQANAPAQMNRPYRAALGMRKKDKLVAGYVPSSAKAACSDNKSSLGCSLS